MAGPLAQSTGRALRLDFDRRLVLRILSTAITSDAGVLAYRKLDDALGLSMSTGEVLKDVRSGKNGPHALVGLLRQSEFGPLAGYKHVNDATQVIWGTSGETR